VHHPPHQLKLGLANVAQPLLEYPDDFGEPQPLSHSVLDH
jgi:hypothetical protein